MITGCEDLRRMSTRARIPPQGRLVFGAIDFARLDPPRRADDDRRRKTGHVVHLRHGLDVGIELHAGRIIDHDRQQIDVASHRQGKRAGQIPMIVGIGERPKEIGDVHHRHLRLLGGLGRPAAAPDQHVAMPAAAVAASKISTRYGNCHDCLRLDGYFTSSIRCNASSAQRAVSGSTSITLTGVPAARFSSDQQRCGRSMRYIVEQRHSTGDSR